MHTDLKTLNRAHGIPETLSFEQNREGMISACISNPLATARVYLQGAHVSHFQPVGEKPLLWLSEKSFFSPQKAIRGGIPLCWPWFGDHPDDPGKPAHGFVRTALWRVVRAESLANGATRISFSLSDTAASNSLWPHAFHLLFTLTFSSHLHASLQISNRDSTAFTCSGALHSYLHVADCRKISISGLEDQNYLDKTDQFREKKQHGPVTTEKETDRIYLDTTAICTLSDPVLQRRLLIHKKGSNTTVIWNPGADKSATMKDMAANGYKNMVCIESVNTLGDSIILQPGAVHTLETRIELATR